ncbi:MAG: SGNH/GDSL hydrolase family protein [Butyrivibrio sp.]|nr:SGNH/GDSL hydrolase family protein [Butyrivibrio sp.]
MKIEKNIETKKQNNSFISLFLKIAAFLLILIAVIVIVCDPFYHYHKPWGFLKAVLNDKEYQVIGTLRHFDYDTLLVGSSVMENNDNDWYDEAFDCKSIKAIRSYGATADLCYLLDEAYNSENEIKYIFYNIDPSALEASTETTYESTGCPMYLYDNNPFNDVYYLFNKDVLFEKIPYQIASSLQSDYDESLSYNWAKWKTFNQETALGLYQRSLTVSEMHPEDYYVSEYEGNINLLKTQIEAHPETEFTFFFPAYSMLWWDGIYRSGERDSYIYNEKNATKELLSYDNVRVFCFQNEPEIVTDLDNYMDSVHFSMDINRLQLDQIIAGEYELTLDNYEEAFEELYEFSEKIVNEYMVPYEEQGLLTYESEE